MTRSDNLKKILPKSSILLFSSKLLAGFIGYALFSIIPVCSLSQQIPVNEKDIDTTDKKDIIDVFKATFHYTPEKIKKRESKKVYFSLLPTSGAVPGGGKALITSTSAGFYLGARRNTSLSTVNFVPYL